MQEAPKRVIGAMMSAHELPELFESLYVPHKLSRAAEATLYQYRLNLRRFATFLQRPPLISDLRDDSVNLAVGWLMKPKPTGLGLSAASASKFADDIAAFWRFLARKRIVEEYPDVEQVREPRRIPVAWTREQLATLWRYLERLPGELAGVPASDWFVSLHSVLWDSGERVGALLDCPWSALDGEWLTVAAETRKGRLSDRLYRLQPQTLELLDRIRRPERDKIWPWPYQREYLWTQYKGMLKRAGLPHDRKHSFHCVRKSHASHLAAVSGLAAAQTAMGHASAALTRDVYVDPRIAGAGERSPLFRPGDPEPPGAA